ncbi:MAG: hypothetical protein ACLFTD_09830 [Halochromatium sp.]
MPDAQDDDLLAPQLVAHLVIANDDPMHFAWLEFLERFTEPRIAW